MYLAKPKVKTEIDLDVLDFARQRDQCTFHPKVEKKSASNTSIGKSNMKSILLKATPSKKPVNKMVFQMEVKIGNVLDKIVIRKNDIVSDVLRQFKAKHKLSEHKEQMLLDFILDAMSSK